MRRREFITLIGGAVAAWPVAARGQQRRIGALMSRAADDPEGQARIAGIVEGLQQLGWTDGRNVPIDTRWPVDDAERSRSAEELVALAPDVILASASVKGGGVAADYSQCADRVRECHRSGWCRICPRAWRGLAATPPDLARSNTASAENGSNCLKMAPNLTRVAVLRDPALAAGIGQFAVIQAMAPSSFGWGSTPIDPRDPGEMERAIAAFAREPNGGLIVTSSQGVVIHRDLIISLALRYRLPTTISILHSEWGARLLRA